MAVTAPARDTLVSAARRLAVFASGLYAAPDYLAERGEPQEPADLATHDGVLLFGSHGVQDVWQLVAPDGVTQ